MKKSMSRVLSLALVLVMLLGVLPMALADEQVVPVKVTAGEVTWKDGTASVTFNADVTDPTGFSAPTYAWTVTGGEAADKESSSCTVTTNKPGTVNVSVTVSYTGEGNQTAKGTATGSAVIPTQPSQTTEVQGVISGPSVAYVGTDVTFNAAPSVTGAEPASWTWGGSDLVNGKTGNSVTFKPTAAGSMTITATPSFASDAPFTGKAGSATVQVYNEPTSITLTPDATKVKIGTAVNLRPNVAPGNTDPKLEINYTVNPVDGTSVKDGIFTAEKAGSYQITATVKNSKGAGMTSAPVTIFVDASQYKVTMTGPDSVKMGDNAQKMGFKVEAVSASIPGADAAINGATAKWSSSANDVATIEADGTVKPHKAGKTTITAVVTVGDETHEIKKEIQVVNEGKIKIDNGEFAYVSGRTYILTPSLSDNTVIGVTYGASLISGSASINVSDGRIYVTPSKPGVVKLKVTADWGGNEKRHEEEEIYVSFYDSLTAEVYVKNGTTAFDFDDTRVFSEVKIDGRTESRPEFFSIASILAKVDYYNVLLEELSGGSFGKITNINSPNHNAFKPGEKNNYVYLQMKDLRFTCLAPGEYSLGFTLQGDGGMTVRTGYIDIHTQGGNADLVYKTSTNRAISMKEDDFLRLWRNSKMGSALKYVKFNDLPRFGTLYKDTKLVNKVNSNDAYYVSGSVDRLRDVTYDPWKQMKSYDDSLTFTMYGESSQDIVFCTMQIKVGSDMNFRDVHPSDWFYDHVQYVYDNGIMDGVSAYEFAPQNKLTRGMVVTMLHRIEGKPITFRSGTFTDVKSGTWYTDAVEWAAANNIVTGYNATTFGPNNNITRQDLAVILYRYAKYKGQSTYNSSSLTGFVDYQRVASYATDAMQWTVYNKIIGGNERGMLNPTGNATRAEAAKMFHMFLELK